jgi:hypothetical protein
LKASLLARWDLLTKHENRGEKLLSSEEEKEKCFLCLGNN